MQPTDSRWLEDLWAALEGPSPVLASTTPVGPTALLPSVFDVGSLATATVAAAMAAIAELHAARTDEPVRRVRVERGHAAVAFRSERYVVPLGWARPQIWDPIAGDYAARDGWIRLHTNYAYHRDAVCRALGVPASRDAVETAVRTWAADDLETAVVREGGCAARLRSTRDWATHAQGTAVADEPLFGVETRRATSALAR